MNPGSSMARQVADARSCLSWLRKPSIAVSTDSMALASSRRARSAQIDATRKALGQLVQSMSPVVIWFDQIQDSRWERLQPTDWLSFAESTPCLIVGTSSGGTADQVTTWSRSFAQRWWIDLPEPNQRREVLSYHLNARGLDCPPAMLEGLTHHSVGLSSAQIEADLLEVIQASLDQERAFQPESLCQFWNRRHSNTSSASPAPPGWRSAHAESQEVPLLPFTVLA